MQRQTFVSAESSTTDSAMKRRKREREDGHDETYAKNKRILQEGFKSLSLAEGTTENEIAAYGLYEVHNCPSHGLFRTAFECHYCNPLDSAAMQTDEATTSIGIPIEKLRSVDSIASTESEEETSSRLEEREYMISMIKGGKRKFVRKVDYLVDELIRKTRKTCDVPVYTSDPDSILPPNIGPSPRTDHAISIVVPFSTKFCSLSRQQKDKLLEESASVCASAYQPILLSGEVTHSDWGIQEVDTERFAHNALIPYFANRRTSDTLVAFDALIDEENDSDMACYEESSHQYSTNSSLGSGESGMLVDSDDDDLLAGSGRSAAFDESSSATSRLDHGRHSPWSSNTSVKTIFTRSAITDDDEDDDVVNIGTF